MEKQIDTSRSKRPLPSPDLIQDVPETPVAVLQAVRTPDIAHLKFKTNGTEVNL
jgi:hypothetical protein